MTTHARVEEGQIQGTAANRVDGSLVIVLLACLLPYINLGPLSAPSQVQPWAGVLAWIWFGFRSAKYGLHISRTQVAFLLFALYFMVNVYGGDNFDLGIYLRRSGTFLLSAGIFLACQYLTPATLWRALKIALPIWFAFGALRYVSSSIYYTIVTPLVPTVVVSAARGSSSLSPEATDFGFTMVALLVLCMVTRRCLTRQGIQAEKWPIGLAIASAFLSLSGAGYMGLALVGLIYVLTGRAGRIVTLGRAMLALFLAAYVAVMISMVPEGTVRGIDLLRTSIQNPDELLDTTILYRVVHNVVGVLGAIDSGYLGYGAGSFRTMAPAVYFSHDLEGVFGLTGHYAMKVPITLATAPLSQFALIMLEFGAVGALYLVFVSIFALRSRIPFKAAAVAVLFFAWMASFPAGWPPFWIIIGVMMSPHFVAREPNDARSPEANFLR